MAVMEGAAECYFVRQFEIISALIVNYRLPRPVSTFNQRDGQIG